MPRATKRQRIVFCDCLDCTDFVNSPNSWGWEAAAKQLPPPRSLLVVLEGFNCAPDQSGGFSDDPKCLLDQILLPHVDNVARHGVSFCLAETLPDEDTATGSFLERVLGNNTNLESKSLPQQFKGMQAAVASTSAEDLALSQAMGCHTTGLLSSVEPQQYVAAAWRATAESTSDPTELEQREESPPLPSCLLKLPPVSDTVERMLKMLHLSDAPAQHGQRNKVLDMLEAHAEDVGIPELDMLVLHVKLSDIVSAEQSADGQKSTIPQRAALQWVDAVMKGINRLQSAHDTLLVHVVTSFDDVGLDAPVLVPGGAPVAPGSIISHSENSPPSNGGVPGVLRPKQTWQVSGMSDVKVPGHRPVMVSAVLTGVTRCDEVDAYNLSQMLDTAGQGCIQVDRLIHEIAYKIARAHKYGS